MSDTIKQVDDSTTPAVTLNADLVAKVRRILNELSLDVATPDEARAILGLKGRANVGF